MTLRSYTIEKKGDKRNQIWEWEETPELIAAVEQLQKSSQVVKDIAYVDRPIHIGNQNYAPLKKRNA
jgi:hypothetical protein